jgi:shikimate 5-dehydrogenase
LTEQKGYMGFIGVTTASSSIMKLFPLWADILGLPTKDLVGHDLPLNATREQYRNIVQEIRDNPLHRGALVTTHKMNLFAAAQDLFDEMDPFASTCHEISSISKKDGRLIGRAKDPVTVDMALNDFLPKTYFKDSQAEVLILGAGGSGTALSWALAERAQDLPTRITVTAQTPSKLEALKQVHDSRGTPKDLIKYITVTSAEDSDELVAAMPEGSLIVNSTGLGKDRPGSPLSDNVEFPKGSYVWEFNYRGSLEFLHQAQAQEELKRLHVIDGWRYFIHGWSQVIADVFDINLTSEIIEELALAAEQVKG